MMLPLCGELNGAELMNLYEMCKLNAVAMFRSLKDELAKLHHEVLPIGTFLHFLDRMRFACDEASAINLMLFERALQEYIDND